MNEVFSILQIIRPLNVFISIISTIIAASLIDQTYSPTLPYVCFIVLTFVAASNIINDIFDISIDSVNRPSRALVSNSIPIFNAKILVLILYVLGIIATMFINCSARLIVLFIVLPLLILYTPFIKKIVFVGNLFVGVMLGFVFVFTELSILGHVDNMWIPFMLATGLTTIREIIKDCADVLGDSLSSVHTLPSKLGFPATLWIVRFLVALLCFFAIMPVVFGLYNFNYLALLLLLVEIPLFWLVYYRLNTLSAIPDYIYSEKFLKLITIGGVVVIYFTI